ncbi:hypothetical protein FPQ18DRAFT_78019 [Pyronema domesticum]|nr:hypothetical protein FPQ18DRAFT_78019 [Pyronema domesticum]
MSGTSTTKPPLNTAPNGQAGATASIMGLVSPHASASTTPQTVLDNLSRPILGAPTTMASASSTYQQQAKEDIEMKDKDDDDDDLIFVSERPLSSPQKRTFGANTSATRRSTFSSLEFSVPNAQYKTEPATTGSVNLDHLLMKLERDRKSVLGKRERADTPVMMLSPELFEEVTLVNGMFRRQCMDFVDEPATFSLCVAGFHDWEVLLAFPDNYPKVPPIVAKAPDGKNSTTVYELTKEILSREEYKDGKPMLERLMRKLVETLAKRLPNIPWKHMPGRGASLANPTSFLSTQDLSYVRGRRPTYIEIEQHMNALRAASAQYPPKLPVFKHREGWSTAFISERFAQTQLFSGNIIEGNERLEYLGDSVLHTLTAATMMRLYQLNEHGMTTFGEILNMNALFRCFSRAYEFPSQLLIGRNRTRLDEKEEADIFEAVVGGLFEDSAYEDRGWIELQNWFDVLIEPWIDWLIARSSASQRQRFITYNRTPLQKSPSWLDYRRPIDTYRPLLRNQVRPGGHLTSSINTNRPSTSASAAYSTTTTDYDIKKGKTIPPPASTATATASKTYNEKSTTHRGLIEAAEKLANRSGTGRNRVLQNTQARSSTATKTLPQPPQTHPKFPCPLPQAPQPRFSPSAQTHTLPAPISRPLPQSSTSNLGLGLAAKGIPNAFPFSTAPPPQTPAPAASASGFAFSAGGNAPLQRPVPEPREQINVTPPVNPGFTFRFPVATQPLTPPKSSSPGGAENLPT